MRAKTKIFHHIFSSIWTSVKYEFLVIKEKSCWKLGNGEKTDF